MLADSMDEILFERKQQFDQIKQTDEVIAHQRFQDIAELSEELEKLENQLQDAIMHSYYNESKGLSKQQMSKIKKMKIGSTKKECSICCCQFKQGEIIMQIPCKHIFHQQCLKPWLKQSISCPMCRANLINNL